MRFFDDDRDAFTAQESSCNAMLATGRASGLEPRMRTVCESSDLEHLLGAAAELTGYVLAR